jgi:hypothetical protein
LPFAYLVTLIEILDVSMVVGREYFTAIGIEYEGAVGGTVSTVFVYRGQGWMPASSSLHFESNVLKSKFPGHARLR